jgi:hypothetical protein
MLLTGRSAKWLTVREYLSFGTSNNLNASSVTAEWYDVLLRSPLSASIVSWLLEMVHAW